MYALFTLDAEIKIGAETCSLRMALEEQRRKVLCFIKRRIREYYVCLYSFKRIAIDDLPQIDCLQRA